MVQLFGPHNSQWQRWIVLFLATISSILGIIYMIMCVATCGIGNTSATCPIEAQFSNISLVWSFLNSITDLVLAILCVQLIYSIKMGVWAKITAGGLLLLGTVGGVASCLRLSVYLGSEAGQNVILQRLIIGRWSQLECGLCMVAANLATLRPLFRSILERTRGSSGGSRSTGAVSYNTAPLSRTGSVVSSPYGGKDERTVYSAVPYPPSASRRGRREQEDIPLTQFGGDEMEEKRMHETV